MLALAERVKAGEAYDSNQNGLIRDLREREVPALRQEVGELRREVTQEVSGLRSHLDAKMDSLYERLDGKVAGAACCPHCRHWRLWPTKGADR